MQNNLIFDRNLFLSRRRKLVNTLPKADFLIKHSFENIQERLSEMNRSFSSVLNLGSKIGSEKLPGAVVEADCSLVLLANSEFPNKILINEEDLSLGKDKFDLIVSVLNLHSVNNLPACLYKLKEALKPNGILIASIFGGENLFELRQVLIRTELEIYGGVSPRMMPSIEIKQLGGLLQKVGLASPVVDSEKIEVHYKDPLNLLRDIKNMGESNILFNRNHQYVGKKFWNSFIKNYREMFPINKDEVLAKFEILTMTAVK